MEIITGVDGYYVVRDNKLLKIVDSKTSEDYYLKTGGWIEYHLEDGTIIKIGKEDEM